MKDDLTFSFALLKGLRAFTRAYGEYLLDVAANKTKTFGDHWDGLKDDAPIKTDTLAPPVAPSDSLVKAENETKTEGLLFTHFTPNPQNPSYTLDDLKNTLLRKGEGQEKGEAQMSTFVRPALQGVLSYFGATTVPTLAPEHYRDVIEVIRQLYNFLDKLINEEFFEGALPINVSRNMKCEKVEPFLKNPSVFNAKFGKAFAENPLSFKTLLDAKKAGETV